MSTIALEPAHALDAARVLAPSRPPARRHRVGRGRSVHLSRPAQRRPVGVQPPRLTFVETTSRACQVASPVRPVRAVVTGGWQLTNRGVGVVVSMTSTLMAVALVAMVMRFLVVTTA